MDVWCVIPNCAPWLIDGTWFPLTGEWCLIPPDWWVVPDSPWLVSGTWFPVTVEWYLIPVTGEWCLIPPDLWVVPYSPWLVSGSWFPLTCEWYLLPPDLWVVSDSPWLMSCSWFPWIVSGSWLSLTCEWYLHFFPDRWVVSLARYLGLAAVGLWRGAHQITRGVRRVPLFQDYGGPRSPSGRTQHHKGGTGRNIIKVGEGRIGQGRWLVWCQFIIVRPLY